jgi:protein-disulfide isomerase
MEEENRHEESKSEHSKEDKEDIGVESMAEDKTPQVTIDNNPDKKFNPEKLKKTVKKNPWVMATIVLGIIALVLLVMMLRGGITGNIITGKAIGGQEAGDKLIDYLNSRTGGGVEYISHEDKGDLYEVMVSYQGQNIPVYITKDGEYFVQGAELISGQGDTPTQKPQTPSEPVEVSIDDDAIKGDPNAPVTIIEFSDYECPFCGKYFEQTYPQIKEEYVDTGKVRLVFRDFPLGFHDYAQKAGEAAECAGEQGKYWEMHDKLFENQDSLDVSSLKQYAQDIGLDTASFNSCLDSGMMEDEVKSDMDEGQDYGVTGTPAFFINGIPLTGAQPFSAFKEIIDAELAKQ